MMMNPNLSAMVAAQHRAELQRHAAEARIAKLARPSHRGHPGRRPAPVVRVPRRLRAIFMRARGYVPVGA